jgi:hypothetical protein
MALPCCDWCYTKYLTEEDTVKEEFLLEAFGPCATVTSIQPEPSAFSKQLIAQDHAVYVPLELVVVVGDVETKLCSCDCHKDGLNVMH